MAQFTKEQIEKLKPYEHHFRTAVYSGYVRGTGELDKTTMVEAMEAATGNRYGDMLRETCGSCVTRFVKEVGEIYYASIEALERDAKDKKNARARELRAERRKGGGDA